MKTNSTIWILKKMAAFSVPLILSGLLQQLFNWVDALIVGNFVGEAALGGVGATSSIYNLFVTVIVGFTSGLSVLFAQRYGKKETAESTKILAVCSTLLTLTFTIIALLGIVFSEKILELTDTPSALFQYAEEYLWIILIGIPFLALYNIYSALLRGTGNSRVPFVAVLISSIINVVLDFIFVVILNFGVSGAAAATVISQGAMTVYILIYTIIKHPEFRFSPFCAFKHGGVLLESGKFGVPPAVQACISSVGNVFLQRFMNGLGEHTVAAITTAYRVDSVLLLPIINFSTAISTLVAQEVGAENRETAKRIFKLGTIVMAILSAVLTATILLTGSYLLGIFGLTEKSLYIGEVFFNTISIFYVIYGLSMSIKGYLEGNADLLFSAVIGICSLAVRIICSYLFVVVWGNMVVAYAEAFSWVFLLVAFWLRYMTKESKAKKPLKR